MHSPVSVIPESATINALALTDLRANLQVSPLRCASVEMTTLFLSLSLWKVRAPRSLFLWVSRARRFDVLGLEAWAYLSKCGDLSIALGSSRDDRVWGGDGESATLLIAQRTRDE